MPIQDGTKVRITEHEDGHWAGAIGFAFRQPVPYGTLGVKIPDKEIPSPDKPVYHVYRRRQHRPEDDCAVCTEEQLAELP